MIGKTVIVGSKNMKEKILKFITSKFFVLELFIVVNKKSKKDYRVNEE